MLNFLINSTSDKVAFHNLCAGLWDILKNVSEPDIIRRIATIQELLMELFKDKEIETQSIVYKVDTNNIEKDFRYLKGILELYLQGRIPSAYDSFRKWFNNKSFIQSRHSKYPIFDFYRCRRNETFGNEYEIGDLFHIPYDKRNFIGNYRYSISGTPALYIAGSVYTCWEELRRPSFSNMTFAHITPNEDLNLFDMRLMRNISSKIDLSVWVKRLPLIIFSSLAVAKEGTFKPEYIIPQMLLQCIISRNSNKVDGIIYNSFRSNTRLQFFKPTNYNPIFDNIVLAATEFKQEGYSKDLGEKLLMHYPISYDALLLKRCLSRKGNISSQDYKYTVTFDIENACKSGQAYNIATKGIILNYLNKHGEVYLW